MTISVVPASEATWPDLQLIFGTRGPAARCQCQRYKLRPREAFAKFPVEERADRLRDQIDAEPPAGLIAYLDDDPAGWCAVQPRPEYVGLVRNNRVPWEGRTEDKADPTIWAVTCFFTRKGFRKRGVSQALAKAAVTFARDHGAKALEGYPMTTTTDALLEELNVGTQSIFAQAGLTEVTRPTLRRSVMRIDFR